RRTIGGGGGRGAVKPAWVRQVAGRRRGIWGQKKPPGAISARANGPATLQNARLRNASPRVQRCGAEAEPAPDLDPPRGRKTPVAWVRIGGRSIPMTMAGMRIAAITVAAPTMVASKPVAAIATTRAGGMKMPPELAPLSAKLIASPRWRSNHRLSTLVIAATCIAADPTAMTR